MTRPACHTCATLGDEIANTGRGEYLPAAWDLMKRSGLGHDVDLGRCPECDACFQWRDRPQFYGSGNLDEEHLRRLPEAEATLVRALLAAKVDPQGPARVIGAALVTVDADLLRVLLMHLAITCKPAFEPIVPAMLERLYTDSRFSDIDALSSYVGWSLARACDMIARIDAEPRPRTPAVDILLTRCRSVKP